MRRCALLGFGTAFLLVAAYAAPAGNIKDGAAEKKADALLVILDAQGKQVMLRTWHLTHGTRRMPGVDGVVPKPPPFSGGPAYIEFRDEQSTTFQNGILTLVRVNNLRKIDYDYDKKTVTAVVAIAGGKDATLTGATKYDRINRLGVEGDADLGDLGFASVKFQGGNPKGGITGVRFPNPQPAPEVKPGNVTIIGEDKEKHKHSVADLAALYQVDGGAYRVLPTLMFKKTVKIDLGKIASMRHVEAEDKKQTSYDFEVALEDGTKHTLTLLTKVELEGTKSATLAGLLGRVPVGFKLFPAHTIAELRMESERKL